MWNLMIMGGFGLMLFAVIRENFTLLLWSFAIGLPGIFANAIGGRSRSGDSKQIESELIGLRAKVDLRTQALFNEVATSSYADQLEHVLEGLRQEVARLGSQQPALRFQIVNKIETFEKKLQHIQFSERKYQEKLLDLKRQRQSLDVGAEELSYYVRFIPKPPSAAPAVSRAKSIPTTVGWRPLSFFDNQFRAMRTTPAGYWKSTSNIWGEVKGGAVVDIDGLDSEFEDAAVIDMYRKIEGLKATGRCAPLASD